RDRNVTGVQTCALPIFFRLLRAHLPDVGEEDLNRAAVQGLLTQFYPRVILVTNDSPASASAEATLVSQAAVYDKSYGYLRVARRSEERRVGKEGRCRGR